METSWTLVLNLLSSQVYAFRMEASDLMEIGHITFDQALKGKMTKPRSKYTTGPFFQLVEYQFGEFKILVRFEVDCGDFAAVKAARLA